MNDTPQRIGDADRDAAVQALRLHHEAGRLDLGEFEDRMGTALSARTQDQLDPLFTDLPPVDSNPRALAVPTASGLEAQTEAQALVRNSRSRAVLATVSGVIWPVIVVVNLIFGFHLWWLFPVAALLMPVMWSLFGGKNEAHEARDRRRAERRGRRL